MFSDFIESPSKGCFSFNDHIPPSHNMDEEMNEISSQASLDYIFDSFYSTRVSLKYDTGFELPEDCNNMSFSELFDQELLSTQENKDCNITNGTEKKEPFKSCYNGNDSLDTTNRNSLINTDENISSSSTKTFIPKKGINRTLIKNSDNCDITHLMYKPFCETQDNFLLSDPKIPVMSQKSVGINIKTEQNIFDSKTPCSFAVRPNNSVDGLQNNINNHTEVERNVRISSSKMSTPYTHDIDYTIVKTTENNGVEDKSYFKKINVKIEQRSTEIGMCKSVKTNESILEEKAMCFSGDNSFDTTYNQKLIKAKSVEKNHLSQLSNNYVSKRCRKNGNSVKSIKRCGIKLSKNQCFSKQNAENIKNCVKSEHFKQNLESCTLRFTAKNIQNTSVNHSKVLISAPSLVSMPPQKRKNSNEIKGHQVKQIINKPKKQNLNSDQMSAEVKTSLVNCKSKLKSCQADQQNIVGVAPLFSKGKLLVKNDTQGSSKNKSSPSKCDKINRTCYKTIENHDDQKLTHKRGWKSKIPSVEQSSVKIEIPTTKKLPKIIIDAAKQKVVYSSADSQKKDDSQIQDDFVTAITQTLIPKRKSTKQTSTKTTVKHNEQIMKKPTFEMTTKAFQSEPIDQVANLITEETTVGINKSVEEDSTDLPSDNFKHTNIKKQDVIVEKEEIQISIKNNDTNFQTSTVENEKKKITWEEFKAKREKMGISSMTDYNEDLSNDNTITEIKELESVKKEFDQNTVTHFSIEKKIIEDSKEKTITDVKDIDVQEVWALQNKRLKIEYFQKLSPSSIASEIAKISSCKKSILAEDNENDNASNDSAISYNETKKKYSDVQEDLVSPKKDNRPFKKYRIPRVGRTRPDIPLKTGLDGSYHHIDAAKQVGEYSKNYINQRSLDEEKTVVYVGQIPIRYGKPYLQHRFKTFGNIKSISVHKKPDFRVYYAFVTFNDPTEAAKAIKHGNDDTTLVHLDIRYGERKQNHTPYYDLDDEWLTDWYGYNNQSLAVMRPQCPKNATFEDELKAFYELAQNKKSHQRFPQVS